MSVKFERLDGKSFHDFMEMGVKFKAGKGEQFQTLDEFTAALDEFGKMKSSIFCDYDDQESAWREFANLYKYDGIKELASAVERMAKGFENLAFEGLEGLAALSGNKRLLDYSDYGHIGVFDFMVMSFFYGGKRAKQWIKNAREAMTPALFISELDQFLDRMYGPEYLFKSISENKFQIEFQRGGGGHDPDGIKDEFYKLLENADSVFDFEIAEDRDSDVWTVTVKKG